MIKKLLDNYRGLSVEIKSAGWFMFCSMMPQIMSVLTTTIFTRVLSTADYGYASNYNAWFNIISIFLTLSLGAGVYNNAMLKYESNRDSFDDAMMGLSLLLGILGMAVFVPFLKKWGEMLILPKGLVLFLCLHCLCYNPYNFMIARAKYEYNYKKLIRITVLTSVLASFCSVLLVVFVAANATAKIVGQYFIILLIGMFGYLTAYRRKGKLFDYEKWKYALKFNLPLIPHYLSLIILNQSDRIMITRLAGISENAIYTVAYSAASMLLVFNSSISQAFTPWVYSALKENKEDKLNMIGRFARIFYIAFAVIIVIFILLTPEAIAILAGKKYGKAIYLMPPIAVSMFYIFIYNMLSILEFYHEKTRPVMICSTLAALSNIGLNYVFIPRYGYAAAAYTTLFSYGLSAIMHFFVVKKIYNQSYRGKDIFDIKSCVAISVILLFFNSICDWLYRHVLIRYLLCAFFLLIIYYKRNIVIKILRRDFK